MSSSVFLSSSVFFKEGSKWHMPCHPVCFSRKDQNGTCRVIQCVFQGRIKMAHAVSSSVFFKEGSKWHMPCHPVCFSRKDQNGCRVIQNQNGTCRVIQCVFQGRIKMAHAVSSSVFFKEGLKWHMPCHPVCFSRKDQNGTCRVIQCVFQGRIKMAHAVSSSVFFKEGSKWHMPCHPVCFSRKD